MVNVNLFTCCKDCNHADLIQEEKKYINIDEEVKDITIRCIHERVCYIVADYRKGSKNE